MITENNKTEEYNNKKAVYLKYIEIMDKSEYFNSQTRYQFEVNMLQDMYKCAYAEQNAVELEFISKKYELVSENFKNRFGVIVKKLS